MDIDIHLSVRDVDEEEGLGRPVLLEHPLERLVQRRLERPVLDRPRVDEEELAVAVRPSLERPRHEPPDAARAFREVDLHQAVEDVPPVELEDALAQSGDGGAIEDGPPAVGQDEPDGRGGQGGVGQVLRDGAQLGPVGAEELPAGREVEEQVPDLDRRPLRERDVRDPDDPLPFPLDARPAVALAVRGLEQDAGDRRDARQRLAAEAERRDALEVLLARDLARRMPAERDGRVLGGHALAVVPDGDEPLPAVGELDADVGRSGVEGILDELLDDRDRPLDDLAGRDLPRKLGEDVYSWHGLYAFNIYTLLARGKPRVRKIPPGPLPKGGIPGRLCQRKDQQAEPWFSTFQFKS